MNLNAELVMNLHVLLADTIPIGNTNQGNLNIIPIIGGDFEGPLLCGTICHGGADWNTAVSPQISHAFAKYWLKTDDGVYISVENEGYLDHTNPTAVIKTTPKYQCDINGLYGYLCKGVYAGELTGGSNNSVDIRIYSLK